MGSSGVDVVKAVKYFNEIDELNKNLPNNNQNNSLESLKEKIKLEFSLQNCTSGSKYSINATFLEKEEKDFLTEEKIALNDEIEFDNFYICNYYFEKEQKMQFIIYKEDSLFNQFTTLATIVGSKHSKFVRKYEKDETLIIKAVKLGKGKSYVNININIKENSPDNEYLEKKKLIFIISSNNSKIYSSESISREGRYEQIKIPSFLISPEYKVDICEPKSDNIKCSYTKSIESLKMQNNNNNNNLQLKLPISKNTTLSIYDNSKYNDNYSFFDFISSGIRLKLSIGIDFTGSNGHPLDKDTLHCIIKDEPNDYERVIKSIGNILSNYNYQQLYPVYGFGAILNNSLYNEPSMCFNINFSENSEIYTINNILKVYRQCLDKLTFAGPTFFAPIINKVIENIRRTDNNMEYNILMILTDGVIDDMDSTIDALVEGSFLPLSVIIVGIGNADFTKMDILDGNDIPLVSKQQIRWCRDIVQFIQYNKYKNNEHILTKEILEEIPRQIIEYYTQNNYNPDKIKQIVRLNSMQNNYNNNYNPNNRNIKVQESKNELPTKSQIHPNKNDLNDLPTISQIHSNKNDLNDLPTISQIHANQNKNNSNEIINNNCVYNPYDQIKFSNISINTQYENDNNQIRSNNIDLGNNNYNNLNLENNGKYANNINRNINYNNINLDNNKNFNNMNSGNNNDYNNFPINNNQSTNDDVNNEFSLFK